MWYSYKHGYEAGMRVEITRQHKYKKTKLVGKVGTVMSGYGNEVLIDIDGMCNQYSSTGYYYFKPSEINLISEPIEDIMEEKNMPNITNYFNAVKIQYVDNPNPSKYIYANFEPDLKVGDLVVIQSANHGLGLAKVVEVIDKNDFETSREVVAKVDTYFYDERVAMRKKSSELKAKMQERAKQLQDIALYQMLAKDDPDMMALLDEYQALPRF